MNVTSNPDIIAIRDTIRADPAEDTYRHVLADKLEELGDIEWAEFTRIGLKLAPLGPVPIQVVDAVVDMPYGPNYYSLTGGETVVTGGRLATHPRLAVGTRVDILKGSTLRRKKSKDVYGLRITKLLDDEVILVEDNKSKPWEGWADLARFNFLRNALEPRLRLGQQCGECGGKGRYHMSSGRLISRDEFVCSSCRGRGWLGVLSERQMLGHYRRSELVGPWLIPATFSRGLVSGITCTMEWWMANGKAAVREWPIIDIDFSTHRPWQHRRSGKWYCSGAAAADAVDGQDHEWIPNSIWDILWTRYREQVEDGTDSPTAARAALSLAALLFAKEN